jgi:transposase
MVLMKPFNRIKKINGIDYLYRITPYYDPVTKTTKQRSQYLGKLVDGEAVKVRKPLVRTSFDYGVLLPSWKVIVEMEMLDMLNRLFSRDRAKAVLALAINRAVEPVAFSNAKTWYERTILSPLWGELPLSSQALSDLTKAIGESGVAEAFTELLLKKVGMSGPLLYDITSFSSTSQLMDMLEYGYSRDEDGLPQFNLSIFAHKELGIPLGFQTYPGSIVDVSTIRVTVARLQALGLDGPTVITDRGFYSHANLREMLEAGYDFIMPVPANREECRSLMTHHHATIERPENLVKFEDETLFVKAVKVEADGMEVSGYLYYDLVREADEKTNFYRWMEEVRQRLADARPRSESHARKIFLDKAGGMAQYFEFRYDDGRIAAEAKPKAVSQRLNRCGMMLLVHSGHHSWQECLLWSRERDVIEKMFRTLKADIKADTTRAHADSTMKGAIFVNFLALIIRTRLRAMMKARKLCRRHSLESAHLELSKLRRVELADGSFVTCEVTAKQKAIIEGLGLDLNALCA